MEGELIMLTADGFDKAFIGTATRCGQPTLAVYSVDKCIKILMKRDGMTNEEALEYFYYNVVGGWHGETTPLFVESVSFTEACESYWEEENERAESEKNLATSS
jgi:hypothetical protein